ncbi:MAG TPA: 16S rRNA (cytosine(967)-C(5))-methyltransferase RsmB [Stenotrophomonas sp.]|jgi:16S rRNA (cytosine967-C5)-methyltransferase
MSAPADSPGVATRVLAARVLGAVIVQGRSLKGELATALPSLPELRDRALVEAICFAALRRRAVYQKALEGWLERPLMRRDAELTGLLLTGFAQLDALQLAPHAALSATVEACRALGRPRQAGMVNALLRRAQREGFPQVPADAAWPSWLRELIRKDWGARAHDIFEASAHAAPMWLRVNRQRTDRDAYLAELAAAGIEGVADPLLADAVRLAQPQPVSLLPRFAEGVVSVQDGSAQQVADAFALAPGARVLDACVAPGGKAAHLLERDPSLQLTGLDVDERRLRRVGETLARVGLAAPHVQLQAADAAMPDTWWDGVPFDAVLLDAPCSATGIVRRQPDVLLHRRPDDLIALGHTQARLLDAAWQVLGPGGQLVYTTCSILRQENEGQIESFLARTPDASVMPLSESYGHPVGAGRQRLPAEHDCDGFYFARLTKRS